MGEPFIMSKDETLGFARGMLINCTDVQLERFYESVIHYLKNNKKDSSKADEEIIKDIVKRKQEESPMLISSSGTAPISILGDDGIPPACRACPTHPSNGGNGICHCTLGTPQVTC